MLKSRLPFVLTAAALIGLLPMAPIARAGDVPSGSIEWTFYNSGSDTPCASFDGGPALGYGGYGDGPEAPSGCAADNWTGHGTGFFESPETGLVEFCAVADDYIDVTIREDLVLDNVTQDGGCADYWLIEGLCYELTLDFVEFGGYATFFIGWDAYGSSEPMTTSDLVEGPCPHLGGYDLRFSYEVPESQPRETETTSLPSTL